MASRDFSSDGFFSNSADHDTAKSSASYVNRGSNSVWFLPSYQPLPSTQSRLASQRQQPYSVPTPQAYPPPQQYSVSSVTQQPYSSPQPPIGSYLTPQPYPSYQVISSDEKQDLPYPQPYQPVSYDSTSSTLGPAAASGANTFQTSYPTRAEDQYGQTSYSNAAYQTATQQAAPPQTAPQETAQATSLLQPTSSGDALARVSVQDGEEPQSFISPKALASYLQMFPEADNDQGCRIFKYGPKCPTNLLMPLFEHFDFSRFSIFPYGFASDYSVADHWGAGSCNCSKCIEGQLCGHYVLHKNLQFYTYLDVTPSSSISPRITSKEDSMIISTGTSQYNFRRADWTLQFFRFRSRRLQTTVFAYDALVYQNFESEIKLRSDPLDYVFAQLDSVLSNWESALNASSQFLNSFRVEVLEERLETDRSIVRNLLMAAQHWEEFRKVLQNQLHRLEFLENVHGDPRWTEGRENYYELIAIATGYVQKFRAIDYRITTELMQETDSLIQRVTNLITIDEGYRSRDQNESIRRLTWITGIFSMQVDLFNQNARWQYYIYTALVLMFIVFSGYALLRSRRRVAQIAVALTMLLLTMLLKSLQVVEDKRKKDSGSEKSLVDLEMQPPSTDETPTILKWAASSGRTDVVRNILHSSNKKTSITPGMSGQALLMAIQNGHSEAANLLIQNGEGLTYRDESNATVLHWAARMGQTQICQLLLEKGIYLGAKDQDDQTPLDWAMRGNNEQTINLLLKGGKHFTRQETANLQSLHFSARTGDIDMIKEFHKQGSSLEARDGKGQTVLFHAVKGKQHEIVKWLTQEGQANVQAVDKEGLTALHVAAQGCDMKSAEILVERSADVNALSSKNLTPLHCVPHSEGVRVLILLHEKGADINAADKDNNRITHKAASKGDSASLLFKVAGNLGADLAAPGAQGNTPAHLAARSGSKMILGVLAQKAVDIKNPRNLTGYTPLMMAAQAGKAQLMSFLLEKGADYNVNDSDGRSLIELTIAWGNPEVMAVLQQHGANYSDVTTAGGDVHPVWKAIYEGQGASVAKILDGGLSIEYEHRGVRLLQLAIEAINVEVVRLLIERGATVTGADTRGWTALHSAAYSGNVELLLLILQKTNNKEPKDQQGWTPLDLAAFYKHDEIMNLLNPDGNVKEFAWMKAGRTRIEATNFYVPRTVDSVIFGKVELPG
ncbi:MAG: hypothetical protein Q9214_000305 [Letrouitia sp. 1 TL-2023]